MTLADDLVSLSNLKQDIKAAIIDKGVAISSTDTFLTYPDKIASISSGGSGSGDYLVRFIDYDGTILKEEYTNAGNSVAAPAPPIHSNLTFYGWNNSYSNITRSIDIGAVYTTTSGETYLNIELNAITGLSIPVLNLNKSNTSTLTVDWGDGTTSTSASSGRVAFSHSYSAVGSYSIKLAITSGSGTYTLGGDAFGYSLFGQATATPDYLLKSAFCGSSCLTIGQYGLAYSNSLKALSIAPTMTSLGATSSLAYNPKLAVAVIPSTFSAIPASTFQNSLTLQTVVLPAGVTSLGSNALMNCYRLSLVLPRITAVQASSLQNCLFSSIIVPSSVTSIGTSAFGSCTAVEEFKFESTTPPILANINAFTGISGQCKIKVPSASLGAYQAATNWSSLANYMEGY